MRLETQHRVVVAEAGKPVDLEVDVVNNADLIDGVSARLIGLPDAVYTVEPQLLPLFPGAEGRLRVRVDVPSTLNAGSHPLTVEVVSHGTGAPTQHLDLDLSVGARPAVRMHCSPRTLRARRGARFLLEVENPGNVALDVTLTATVEDARTVARFNPRTMRVEPGARVPAILAVKGPRMVTGAEMDRVVGVSLAAVRAHRIPAMDDVDGQTAAIDPTTDLAATTDPTTDRESNTTAEPDTETERAPDLVAETQLVLRQRPLLSRGLLTALVLGTIIALWAFVFLFGLQNVLGGDPITKTAAASFYGAEKGDLAQVAAARPVGTLPKTGRMPAGVGGVVEGTITARSNKLPVGRILVDAYRSSPEGLVRVGSAASQADGTYGIDGLFPSDYLLRFSAEGFTTVWWPAAPSQGKADPVTVVAQETASDLDVQVAGLPASISGSIDDELLSADVPVTVTARSLDLLDVTGPSAQQQTTDGTYRLTDLPAPATYELSFVAEGYETTTVSVAVTGGENRLQPSVVPDAQPGAITGQVADGDGSGIGNVTVSTTVGTQEISVVTPTVGALGAFTLGDLPNPGTYLLTFSADGYGSTTQIVELDPTTPTPPVDVTLVAGTGSLTGRLIGPDGSGLGGATVTVGGVDTGDLSGESAESDSGSGATGEDGEAVPGLTTVVPTTTTLTTPTEAGRFSIAGLAAPGDYTLTFTLDGYAPTTVPVSLSAEDDPPDLEVQMQTKLGGVGGTVLGPENVPFAGAVITLTDGTSTWTATSGGEGSIEGAGGFRVDGLAPGSYSVTVTYAGLLQQTALVVVFPGLTAYQDLQLFDGGS